MPSYTRVTQVTQVTQGLHNLHNIVLIRDSSNHLESINKKMQIRLICFVNVATDISLNTENGNMLTK